MTLFLPLLFALLLAFVPKNQRKVLEGASFVFSLVVFALSLYFWSAFNNETNGFQFLESFLWLEEPLVLNFTVGLDGVSLFLFVLTAFLMPLVVLASSRQIERLHKSYYIFLFVLETGMLGTFATTNLFCFFLFWEMILIPMFFIIGIWGSAERRYAAFKFILFTAVGSFMMLAAIIYLYTQARSFDFVNLYQYVRANPLSAEVQMLLFLGFALAFAIKVPMFPFHTWLPVAHVEAPTAGSVILAGVLLKMGAYGFLRLAIPLFPHAVAVCLPYLIALSVVAILYGALVSYAQTDMKKLVAYSSISHLGYVTLGLFVMNTQGVEGSVLQMVNHGISTAGLFLLVGALYHRYHTREIAHFNGMAKTMPKYSTVFMIVALSSIGLPLTNGFVGEFLVLTGAFREAFAAYTKEHCLCSFLPVTLAASGMIFSALYMLWLVERVFFGGDKPSDKAAHGHAAPTEGETHTDSASDLTWIEALYFAPIVGLILWIGIYPSYFLSKISVSVQAFLALVK